jgi:hypothetical protein
MNSECSRMKACINQRCKDPCLGTCGNNARCNVVNHIPMCSCPTEMTGNPFSQCRPVQKGRNYYFITILILLNIKKIIRICD